MPSTPLLVTEVDQTDNVIATYVQSAGVTGSERIDIIPPKDSKSLWQKSIDVFLPVGYPNSVTKDYLEYQIYDSLQAFSSSIAGLLANRAVLSSVGVGDASASPTAALLLTIFQESVGRLATILFAHRFGTSLEPECKMYRLLADVLNDAGFVLDCISPAFPKPLRPIILSFSSVLRALCGVAAGSAKASLSAHFARWGNLGELNAKDSSQETVISLLGMWTGTLVVSFVTTPSATWTILILLLSIHLETNRRAVRAVSLRYMNRQRATLVYHHLKRGHVPTPAEVSAQERIFERDGVLRSSDDEILGQCAVGVSMSRLFNSMAMPDSKTMSVKTQDETLNRVLSMFRCNSVVWQDRGSRPNRRILFIVLERGASSREMLAAWWQALEIAGDQSDVGATAGLESELRALSQSRNVAWGLLTRYEHQLEVQGWDLERNALETTAGKRVVLDDNKSSVS